MWTEKFLFVKLLVRQPPGLPDLFLRRCSGIFLGGDECHMRATSLECMWLASPAAVLRAKTFLRLVCGSKKIY